MDEFLKKNHRTIQFNQRAWLNTYTNMYTKLKTSKKWPWKDFLILMNNAVFGKPMKM